MQFNTVTQQQLDRLPIPRNKWRLDLLLKPNRDAVTKKVRTGFETLETCWAEDTRRARALRQLPEQLRKAVGCDPVALAEVLEVGAQHKTVPACGASAAYMRGRRLAFLGSLLKLIDQNKDLEILFISVTEPGWCFDWHDDLTKVEEDIHYRFKRLLNSVRIWDFPGFLVACVNGAYDVETGKIRLVFRGIYAGEKARAAQIWDNDDQLQPSAMGGEEVTDLPRQICSLMPNRIVEGNVDFATIENPRRMREPYHSLYLLWLNRYSLADRLLLDDLSIKRTGLVRERSRTGWWFD